MKKLSEITQHFSQGMRKKLSYKFITIGLILTLYFAFASWHFGFKDGFLVMILTWSFFVLATPVPDGGLILDLPLRYFTGIKMIHSEIIVWIFAITLNVLNLLFNISIYSKTILLTVFKDILINPFPYSLIIILSGIGTFLSLYFGDELYDVLTKKDRVRFRKHHIKLKLIIMVSIIMFIIFIYDLLLKHLGIQF